MKAGGWAKVNVKKGIEKKVIFVKVSLGVDLIFMLLNMPRTYVYTCLINKKLIEFNSTRRELKAAKKIHVDRKEKFSVE